jgi:hypothetical protein
VIQARASTVIAVFMLVVIALVVLAVFGFVHDITDDVKPGVSGVTSSEAVETTITPAGVVLIPPDS